MNAESNSILLGEVDANKVITRHDKKKIGKNSIRY